MKKFFLVFKQNLLYFGSWPSPSVLLLDTTEESLAPSSVVPPLGLSTHWCDLPEPPLLQAEESQLSQPLLVGQMLQALHCLRGPCLDFFQYIHLSLVLGSPELDTALQSGLTGAEQRGRITSPRLSFIISSYTDWSWEGCIESGDLVDGRVNKGQSSTTTYEQPYWDRPAVHPFSHSACWGKGHKKQGSNPWNSLHFQTNRNSGAFWASGLSTSLLNLSDLIWILSYS